MHVKVAHAYLTAMRERMLGQSDVIAQCRRVFLEQLSQYQFSELVQCGYPNGPVHDRFHRHR